MRLAGAALIFLAFIGMGAAVWRERKARLQTLCELCFSLELICAELAGRAAPLPELTALLKRRTKGAVNFFFTELEASLPQLGSRDMPELWALAAEKTLGSLHTDEMDEIIKLGCIIGRYELQEQLSALGAGLNFFRTRRDETREKSGEERRLCMGLAAAAGALLAIVFI